MLLLLKGNLFSMQGNNGPDLDQTKRLATKSGLSFCANLEEVMDKLEKKSQVINELISISGMVFTQNFGGRNIVSLN